MSVSLLQPNNGNVRSAAVFGAPSLDRGPIFRPADKTLLGDNINPYPHPDGVTTPIAQSPPSFATTWLSKMGVMTTPALASETQRARMAANFIFAVVKKWVPRLENRDDVEDQLVVEKR